MKEKNYENRVRRIRKRNPFLCVVFCVITLGVYWAFLQFEIAKETNKISGNNKGFTPALVVFFTIITLGIYGVYWSYTIGVKQKEYLMSKNAFVSNLNIVYLILAILNFILPFLFLIMYFIMQFVQNKMLLVAETDNEDGIYVKDSSIFNRPISSIIVLFIIISIVTPLLGEVVDIFFPDAPGNTSSIISDINNGSLDASDILDQTVKSSADSVVNADSLYIILSSLADIISVLLILLWFKLLFRHAHYRGVLCFKNIGRAFLFALPGLIFAAPNILSANFENFKIGIILLALVPAFVEEISYRGIFVPNMMRIIDQKNCVFISLAVGSLIFGLIHAGNIFAGASLSATAFQVFYAIALGIFLAAILIRSGNLWPCIVIHFLVDFFAFLNDDALESGAVLTSDFVLDLSSGLTIAISVILIAYGIWICRPKKHSEIIDLWHEKWGSAAINR